MAFNIKDTYAKVWSAEEKPKYVKAQISTSRKDQEGNFINSSWFANFVGKCVDKARGLERGTKIKITAGTIENKKTDDGKIYTNVTIFGFDLPDEEGGNEPAPKKPVNGTGTKKPKAPTYEVEDSEDDELPF